MWGDAALVFCGLVLLAAGLLGCLLPVLPGPPLAWLGILALHLTERYQLSYVWLGVSLAAVVAVTVLDNVVPILGVKRWGGTRRGVIGSVLGAFAGLFFFAPLGFVIGAFAGAVVGELAGGTGQKEALRAGFGAFVGFIAGSALKLAVCAALAAWFVAALFSPAA